MRKIFILFVFVAPISLFSQSIIFHGSARNSVYSFQREEDESNTRLYQYGRFNLMTPGERFSLNAALRTLTDVSQSLDNDQRFRAYTLNLKINDLIRNHLAITLGRQFLHPGTVLGGLDGLFADLSITNNISIQAYAGVQSQFERSLKIASANDHFVAGGLLQFKNVYASKAEFIYLRKSDEVGTYWQIGGVNLYNSGLKNTILRLQSHYDFQNEWFQRLLFSAHHQLGEKFIFGLEFKSQYPQVYANSFFTVFEPKAYRKYRANASYEFIPRYMVDVQYQFIDFEGNGANRVFLTVQNNNGSIGIIYENGYAGDQLGLSFDYGYEIFRNLIASLYVDYSRYRTEEIYEYDNQMGNAVRLSYKLNSNWAIEGEAQWLSNRYRERDTRFLNHIAYRW